MNNRLHLIGPLVFLLVLLTGCGSAITVVVTATVPPATATPAPGVCNPADFSNQTAGGPDMGFQYPPMTYYALGESDPSHLNYNMCSSGTPSTILAFLQTSLPAGGWNITASTSSSLDATQIHSSSGYCGAVHIVVGDHSGYPGEWDGDFQPPITPC